ncbi:hypothetical protein C1Y08_08425 [Pseudomonas sp. FW306-02-F02-AA]|uniref:Uncharacterized protein n=1 Tax=Pseudomonas fluorescens TaxID=294 RepID=A0A0N9VKX9_PSEFL|nr:MULTISPECIES: hypothetical protein [Pseudomonas]ALI00510.1 hypothetical protein AO353_05360 [Pseudomonas fluorescens]PMZ03632.1 hypothetical protein C1Y07_13635 [Pseudomonas sp. FW306-02-F02-AB]PMZ09786.1 hypothetical protein C1Y06_12290 [Pseudomonas sp. FW306-02-H06C]PMZ16426.1 hypothetical protein C1Y08_08425 [Pseudomonas sp. FW306-02-F02-AA]PMZ22366.1 hypothetical protein C1Y09_08965 [Pseudomonas sp. FW306-02-F08-AA]
MNETKLLYAAVAVVLFTLIFINLAVMAYVSLFKLDEIESHLTHCYLVQSNRRDMGNGLYGRRYRLSQITAILRGRASVLLINNPQALEDIRRFPPHLRRWVIIPFRMAAFSFGGVLVLGVLSECL